MAGVLAGDTSWRIWGRGDLNVAPVYTVTFACNTYVGYTTAGPHAYIAVLGNLETTDTLGSTIDAGAFELRGLAIGPNNDVAALLWAPSAMALHVQRFDSLGNAGWSAALSDSVAAVTDFNIGESRLEYGNGKYGAYFHVHGTSGQFTGHEGDQLEWIDASSGAVTNGWSWGCSHSMSELLRTSGSKTLAACVTDCYPGS